MEQPVCRSFFFASSLMLKLTHVSMGSERVMNSERMPPSPAAEISSLTFQIAP